MDTLVLDVEPDSCGVGFISFVEDQLFLCYTFVSLRYKNT